MIEVSHISRSFGSFKAVDDISFSIKTGEIIGLLGPNGAGKTTTMRMITGYLGTSAGKISIDGKDITENEKLAKQKIGYMPEAAPLYADMIVADYIAYVAKMQGQNPKEKVPYLCEICGLAEVMHKNISDLSRGYRQRVGLAHALLNDPEILILDEPTSGLDPNQIRDVRNLIKEIGKTRTVIISTHILSEVEMLCDRVIIIAQGKLVADSPTNELRVRFGGSASVQVQVGGCTNDELVTALKKIEGAEAVTSMDSTSEEWSVPNRVQEAAGAVVSVAAGKEIRTSITKLINENKWDLYELVLKRNSLEDVFRTVTTKGGEEE
ncbi:MAG: multidrug ABC transporter ATP-binding protein [Treponema sp. CETP13]|nr:MAG: multidrug ABC transporter ATP-binding protein [Treponema sp. CETP13]